jgi:hypothetical protein
MKRDRFFQMVEKMDSSPGHDQGVIGKLPDEAG